MISLTAIFKKPEDPAAFDEHYTTVHAPLMKKVPGLLKMEVIRFTKMLTPPTGLISEQPYLQCTMYFESMDTFKAAMATEENKAAGKDLMGFAGTSVTMTIGTVEDISL